MILVPVGCVDQDPLNVGLLINAFAISVPISAFTAAAEGAIEVSIQVGEFEIAEDPNLEFSCDCILDVVSKLEKLIGETEVPPTIWEGFIIASENNKSTSEEDINCFI